MVRKQMLRYYLTDCHRRCEPAGQTRLGRYGDGRRLMVPPQRFLCANPSSTRKRPGVLPSPLMAVAGFRDAELASALVSIDASC